MIRAWRQAPSPVGSRSHADSPSAPARPPPWLGRWSPILPILVAEFVVWIGFGALLPIMPLYFRDHGVDFTMLGFIIAAWPAARLIGEPIFGWVADRTRRVPLMVAGAALAGHLRVPAARLRRPDPVHRPARARRLLDRDVRPGRRGARSPT
jgi:predicted MFS family arabinose efflux permease